MDGICGAVLKKIEALGTVGRYFIVSEEEFLECFPEGAERSGTELKKALESLAADGFIDVKYSGGGMFCVALIKNYVPEEPAETEKRKPNPYYPLFFYAFAGGAAGGIVTALFALLFLLC